MKIAAGVFAWMLAAIGSVHAESFVNLGFEDVQFASPPSLGAALPWNEAAPGWGHSEGESTAYVNFVVGHVGFSQNYVLLDRANGAPSGSFALGMHGGTLREDPTSGFVFAFIEQRGLVPAGATTLRLYVDAARFSVSLDGVVLDMHPVGLDPASPTYQHDLESHVGDWSADVASFAGRVATLRIDDDFYDFGHPRLMVVDDIRLLAVPEPSTAALALIGMLSLCVPAWGRARLARRCGLRWSRDSFTWSAGRPPTTSTWTRSKHSKCIGAGDRFPPLGLGLR